MTRPRWDLVEQHYECIVGYCRAFAARDGRLDPDELAQEVAVDVARLGGGYDPRRGKASAWIWWRVRKAADRARGRHRAYRDGPNHTADALDEVLSVRTAPGASPEVATLARECWSRASDAEREAAALLAAGAYDAECRTEAGVCREALVHRLRRLSAFLGAEP